MNKYYFKIIYETLSECYIRAENEEEATRKMEEWDIDKEDLIDVQDLEILEGPIILK